MELTLSDSLLLLYTAVFLIVSFIQYKQILKHKSTIENMEKFFNIFNLDEVVKYSDMRHETTMEKVKKVINEFAEKEKEETIVPLINERFDETKEKLIDSLGDQFDELANVVSYLLSVYPEEDLEEFLNTNLPKTRHLFQFDSDDIEADNQ